MDLETNGACGLLHLSLLDLIPWKIRVKESGDRFRLRHHLTQYPKPLGIK